MNESTEQEILRRVKLLDRKLNYIAGVLMVGAHLATATIIFFAARVFIWWGFALAAGVVVGGLVARLVERTFRPADPENSN